MAEGAKADVGSAVPLKRIEILPDSRLMSRPDLTQQLVVRAHFADGAVRDITDQAIYELSAEGVIEVSPEGLITGTREGEAAVFVRYLGQFALSRCIVIQHQPDFVWSDSPTNNFIDQHVQVRPSELCSDAEFLRTVGIHLIYLWKQSTKRDATLRPSFPNASVRLLQSQILGTCSFDKRVESRVVERRPPNLIRVRLSRQTSVDRGLPRRRQFCIRPKTLWPNLAAHRRHAHDEDHRQPGKLPAHR